MGVTGTPISAIAVLRAALGYQLESAFNVIAVAERATEAIKVAGEHQPDAALLDVEMPTEGRGRQSLRSPRSLPAPAW